MKKSDPPLVAGGGFGCHRKFKLTVIVLLLFAGGNGLPVKAAAQSVGDPPSVMDRIREKVRERSKPPPADWFHRLDTNWDGKNSRDEFRVRNTIPGQSGPSFNQMDIDRNGNLSMVEFSAPVLWRFTRLDSDGDGFLTQTETARYLDIPASRALPPLTGTCFVIDGKIVVASPEHAEVLAQSGRPQVDSSWQPGSLPDR
jgi:hypothetical protein